MNKFEQVSSDGHQMSLAGEEDTRELTCLTSGGTRIGLGGVKGVVQ